MWRIRPKGCCAGVVLRVIAIRIFLIAGALVLLGGASALARPLEVLFVGNSYVYVNNLPEIFARVAAGAGQESPHVTVHAPGGQTLTGDCTDANLLKIMEPQFDVIILQEQSQIPAKAEMDVRVRRSFLDACRWLSGHVHQPYPNTRFVLYQTWARHASAWTTQPKEVEGCGANPDEMQKRLSRWYAEAGRLIGARVAPVGDAWIANYHDAHPLMLHAADGSHPSPGGTYLAALVLVGVIYDIAPVTSYPGPFSADPKEREHLVALACRALGKEHGKP
jgi:hypothetical protein